LNERLQIFDEAADLVVVGKIFPQVIEQGLYFRARAIMVEDETEKVVAAWEFDELVRTKRNAWRMAKKIARRMSAKLNKRVSDLQSEKEVAYGTKGEG
jgi:hypothetical protein